MKPMRPLLMREPKFFIHKRSLMPRWIVPRWSWRLKIAMGQLSKRPKWFGAINSEKQKAVYSKALGENTIVRSSWSATLHWEHAKLMQELEEQALKEQSKSQHDFLSACQAILCHGLQSLKENLTTSYHVLLG